MPPLFDLDSMTAANITISNNSATNSTQLIQSATYFRDINYNLILKKFSNRYVISKIQKQMVHLECFYNYFVDKHLMRLLLSADHANNRLIRVHSFNCQSLNYMCTLLGEISSAYSINKMQSNTVDEAATTTATTNSTSTTPLSSNSTGSTPTKLCDAKKFSSLEGKSLTALIKNDLIIAPKNFQSNLNIKLNKKFLHQTCILPNKLLLLLSNYRFSFPVKFNLKPEGDRAANRFHIINENASNASLSDESDTGGVYMGVCIF